MEILKKTSRWRERVRQWMQEEFDPDEHERAKRHVEATLGPTGLNKEIEQLAFNPHGADAERARGMQDDFNRNIG